MFLNLFFRKYVLCNNLTVYINLTMSTSFRQTVPHLSNLMKPYKLHPLNTASGLKETQKTTKLLKRKLSFLNALVIPLFVSRDSFRYTQRNFAF
jgi:hypothetical protein